MFNDDLRSRVDKMQSEIDALKSIQVDVMRISLSLANLSDKVDAKIDALDKKVDDKIDSLDKKLSAQMTSLDNRLGRMEGWLFGLLTILVGGIASVVVLPYIKATSF